MISREEPNQWQTQDINQTTTTWIFIAEIFEIYMKN